MNRYRIIGITTNSIQEADTSYRARLKHFRSYLDIPLFCEFLRLVSEKKEL